MAFSLLASVRRRAVAADAPPLTSFASSRYTIAPREVGSNVVMGWPNDGASEIRTVRGITFLHTLLPKWSRTSSATCSAELRPGVVHGEDDGRHIQLLVEVGLDQVDVAQKLAQALDA